MEIAERREIHLVEIGADEDHVHFLVRGVPVMPPQATVWIIKSITAREIFRAHTGVRKMLRGGKLRMSGHHANTVGQYGNERVIGEYVQKQGRTYHRIHRDHRQ